MVLGEIDNLTHMVGAMAKSALDGLRNGVGYLSDPNLPIQIISTPSPSETRSFKRSIEGLERGLSPSKAARMTVDLLKERVSEGEGGLILLDCQGRFGADFNSPTMTYAWWSERNGEGVVV